LYFRKEKEAKEDRRAFNWIGEGTTTGRQRNTTGTTTTGKMIIERENEAITNTGTDWAMEARKLLTREGRGGRGHGRG